MSEKLIKSIQELRDWQLENQLLQINRESQHGEIDTLLAP
jgi:phosphopantetheine adenylyltransferase